ncbi:uncharacterized protein LOC119018692 isoform X1 [Acanthopagrus latus]|uniref:uncharacterized protein LOC119018692 isoform X1 n=1 Tax=Acanthopagrus latus TaxID=8177 RepID=UPI00187BDEA6|nr:uncharacterized protein LOC119018692 isoform X1 [Acanthopagrus latus]
MQCKFCKFSHDVEAVLVKHYRLHHRGSTWPCIHRDCFCTFRTISALKSHISRLHRTVQRQENLSFQCSLCDYKDICCKKKVLTHLHHHLRLRETVSYPFVGCSFATNRLNSFTGHTSRNHKSHNLRNFLTPVRVVNDFPSDDIAQPCSVDPEAGVSLTCSPSLDSTENGRPDCAQNVDSEILQHKLASLFLRMQCVLHVPKHAIQAIIDEFSDILSFSKFHTTKILKDVLAKHNIEVEEDVIQEISSTVFEKNPVLVTTAEKGALSTDYRRNRYFKEHFSIIEPTELLYDRTSKKAFVYVSVNEVIELLLNRGEFLEKLVFSEESTPGIYKTFQDGSYFQQNFGENELHIALGLYIDDFELCNPLGTSKKIHKITAVYWVILNLPSKFRSTLHSIHLALLGKTCDVKQFGFEKFFNPLVKDLKSLEQTGVFVQTLDNYVKGSVFCVCADNLGAHGLAGFQESFNVKNFCRFCLTNRGEIATTAISDFQLRYREQHDTFLLQLCQENVPHVNGVKSECVLSKHLSNFHPVTGFPPDILHDFFEGVIPVELSLCLKELILKGFFSLERLNSLINSFPYKYSDRLNKPKAISKANFEKGSIGGNGHENWSLLRFLPLLIGKSVPEQEPAWEILMDLKEIVEIVVRPVLSEEILNYLEIKLSDHRSLLTATFPAFSLRPKHHFAEHYPYLLRCFGPLVELWTMRFESKHSFFKKTMHDAQNFKNVLLTLSTKHQQMMACLFDSQSLFKSMLHVEKVTDIKTSSLDAPLRAVIKRHYPHLEAVSLSKDIYFHGTRYVVDMILSSGHCSGLPEFYKIVTIIVNPEKAAFVVKKLTSWYLEHFRSYELMESIYANIEIFDPQALNDYHPLVSYTVGGRVLVTPKVCLLH